MKNKLTALSLALVPMVAFADDISNSDFLNYILATLGGFKGATVLVAVGLIVQILIKFMSTPLFGSVFKGLSGGAKLLLVSGLTLIGGIISLMASSGMSLVGALVNSATLLSIMVFVNQVYQQFFEKKPALE